MSHLLISYSLSLLTHGLRNDAKLPCERVNLGSERVNFEGNPGLPAALFLFFKTIFFFEGSLPVLMLLLYLVIQLDANPQPAHFSLSLALKPHHHQPFHLLLIPLPRSKKSSSSFIRKSRETLLLLLLLHKNHRSIFLFPSLSPSLPPSHLTSSLLQSS